MKGKTMFKRCMLGMALVVAAASAHAGPFGFEMGQSLDELQKKISLQSEGGDMYLTMSAPKPNSSIISYRLFISPEHGLCSVFAKSNDIKTDSYGNELMRRFRRMGKVFDSSYGKGVSIDFLIPGSPYVAPENWLLSIINKQRVLMSYWSDEKGHKLGGELAEISMMVLSDKLGSGHIGVKFIFDNHTECVERSKTAKNDDQPQNGPFGLVMGDSLANLQRKMNLAKSNDNDYFYFTELPPKPHSAFEDYLLVVTPKHGLCKVIAATPDIASSSFGSELQSKFEGLDSAVTSRYGAGTKFDFLKAGSIWSDPNDWMMGLLKKERTLSAYWGLQGKTLGDGVAMIQLEAEASRPGVGYVTLHYLFMNSDDCIDWIKARESESL